MQIYCKTKAELKKVLEFFKKYNINWRNKADAIKWGMDSLFAPVYINYDPGRRLLTCCECLDPDNDNVMVSADAFISMNTIEEEALEKKEEAAKEEATKKEDIKVSIDDFDKAAGELLRNVQDSILASRIIGLVIGTLRVKLFVKG